MAKKALNVALLGQGFMGRTHSNAWGQVGKFFDVPVKPVMHTSFGQEEENPPSEIALGTGKEAITKRGKK